jgi:prepilin-type N-terminal cleavage/methylation domain-containing protein
MKARSAAELAARRRRQSGFTLIELLIATTLGLFVLGALTSLVVTMMVADNTATGRVEASSQVRDFQLAAYEDFVLARAPTSPGCGTAANQCTTQTLVLIGDPAPTSGQPVLETIRYEWYPSSQTVTRQADDANGTSTRIVSSNVTAYSWYVDNTGAPTQAPTVVISLTVTIPSYNATYSESQTFRFYPRITATPSP